MISLQTAVPQTAEVGANAKTGAESPQEVIQQFRPQAGPTSVANASRLPDKMMAILLTEEAPDAIWWLQKGSAFAMQKEKFQEKILDKHFRGNKFKSLVRNLHRWYGKLNLFAMLTDALYQLTYPLFLYYLKGGSSE